MSKHHLWLAAMPALLGGCASIVKGSTQDIVINSPQGEAHFEVRDRNGKRSTIAGKTPASVTLHKGNGYFSGAEYEVEVSRPGYQTATLGIENRVSLWYLGGNLVFGGLIGLFVVDPVTGAMWRLEPEELHVDLVPLASAANPPLAEAMQAPAPVPLAVAVQPAPVPLRPMPAVEAAVEPSARTGVIAAPVLSSGAAVAAVREAVLRAQPRSSGPVLASLSTGSRVQLESRVHNGEGAWWFVRSEGTAGWIAEPALQP